MCVYLYIHNKYTQNTHTYIMQTKTFILYAINHLTALVQTFGVGKIMFLKEVSYAHQSCIYLIIITIKKKKINIYIYILFFYIYILKCNLLLWYKAEFSASLLQSSVSHDPSEIILICWLAQKWFIIIVNVENSCAASYFCGNLDTFFQVQNYTIYSTL